MYYLAELMRSLKTEQFLTRVPDQSLLAGEAGKDERLRSDRITATRTADGRLALFYTAAGRPIRVRSERLAEGIWQAWWFDPRQGKRTPTATAEDAGAIRRFDPPSSPGDGRDWVLIIVVTTQDKVCAKCPPEEKN